MEGCDGMICDKDCFNCQFDDCINDEMDAEDYAAARVIDGIINPKTQQQKKIAAYQRAYREANKDEIAAYQRAYYEANKDEIAAYQRAYYEANKDEIAAKKRAYYEANKDEIAAYQRAYYDADRPPEPAKALFTWRKLRGYSQAAAGRVFGFSQQAISFMERGEMPVNQRILEAITGDVDHDLQ